MYKSILLIITTAILLTSACKDGSDEVIPITDIFPLVNGNEWDYQRIDNQANDTLDFFADFNLSQLSDNSETAIFELYSVEGSLSLLLISKKGGICIDFLNQSFEEAKQSINTLESECGALLKYPVEVGDVYSYSYSINNRSYSYDVEVSEELVQIGEESHQTLKYTIPSGSNPMRDISEIFFNAEVGVAKIHPEFEKGTEPTLSFILKETNF